MTEKSYVGIGYSLCPVCARVCRHDAVVLLDTRLKDSLKRESFFGWKMCEEHERLRLGGYVALVGCTNTRQPTLETAERTGDVIHVRSSAWPNIFNVPVPDKGLAFVDVDTVAVLKKIQGAV